MKVHMGINGASRAHTQTTTAHSHAYLTIFFILTLEMRNRDMMEERKNKMTNDRW